MKLILKYSGNFILQATLINDGTWVSFILHATSKQQRIHYRNLLYESMGIVSDKKEVDR